MILVSNVLLLVNLASNVFNCRCQHGVLNVCYTAGELERYNGSVICAVENWQNEPFISLREAARQQAPWNHFVTNACKCTTGCLNRKCHCVRKNISCSTYCHKSAPCSNCTRYLFFFFNNQTALPFFFSRVTGNSSEVTETPCHIDFNAWNKFCDDVEGKCTCCIKCM